MENYLQFGDFQKIEKAKGFDHTFTFTIQTLRVLEILNLSLFLFAHGSEFTLPMYVAIGVSAFAYLYGILKFSMETKVPTDLWIKKWLLTFITNFSTKYFFQIITGLQSILMIGKQLC